MDFYSCFFVPLLGKLLGSFSRGILGEHREHRHESLSERRERELLGMLRAVGGR